MVKLADEILEEILECETCKKENTKWIICSTHAQKLKQKYGNVEWYIINCPIIKKEVLSIFHKIDFIPFKYCPIEACAIYLKCLGCGQIHKIYCDGRIETIGENEGD